MYIICIYRNVHRKLALANDSTVPSKALVSQASLAREKTRSCREYDPTEIRRPMIYIVWPTVYIGLKRSRVIAALYPRRKNRSRARTEARRTFNAGCCLCTL